MSNDPKHATAKQIKGFSQELQTPLHLLKKLEWDLHRLEQAPSDVYAAFDFFVTAEHLPDWVHNKSIKTQNDLLKVVSHLANGAKHFQVSAGRHTAVTEIEVRDDLWPDESGVLGPHIVIDFTFRDSGFAGLQLSALSLARIVYSFWEEYLHNNS